MRKVVTGILLYGGFSLCVAQTPKSGVPIITAPGSLDASRITAGFNPSRSQIATCDTLNWPIAASWLPPVSYYTGNFADGWINGPNTYGDKEKAQLFDASASSFGLLHGFFLQFGRVWSSDPNKVVSFKVYDGTGSVVGSQLATASLSMGQIMSDVQNNYYSEVQFATPIALPASKLFFISVDLTGLTWSSLPKDTLSIVSNTTPATSPSMVWEKQSDNQWYRYNTTGSWALDISLYIFPYITNQPTVAAFTPFPLQNVCTGIPVLYDAAPSAPYSTLVWQFGGGTPSSATTQAELVSYPNPGTFTTKLTVIGGGCPTIDSVQATFTVLPSPTISVWPASIIICPNASMPISATGTGTFTWSPSTSLSSSTGPNVIATPANSTIYTVTLTGTNGCSVTATSELLITPAPSASVTTTNTTICAGGSITFDATPSQNVSSYSWAFVGGSPGTSTSPTPTVTYSLPGTYTASLSVANACAVDNSYNAVVTVQNCTGLIDEEKEASNISIHFNNGFIMLTNHNNMECYLTLDVIDMVGRQDKSLEATIPYLGNCWIDLSDRAPGVYLVKVTTKNGFKIQRICVGR